jgi:hypothetical protein
VRMESFALRMRHWIWNTVDGNVQIVHFNPSLRSMSVSTL